MPTAREASDLLNAVVKESLKGTGLEVCDTCHNNLIEMQVWMPSNGRDGERVRRLVAKCWMRNKHALIIDKVIVNTAWISGCGSGWREDEEVFLGNPNAIQKIREIIINGVMRPHKTQVFTVT